MFLTTSIHIRHIKFLNSPSVYIFFGPFFFFLKCTFEQKLQHQAFLASLSTKNILAIRNKNDKTSLMKMISRCPVCLNFVNSCPVFSINTINISVIPVHLNNQRAWSYTVLCCHKITYFVKVKCSNAEVKWNISQTNQVIYI